LRQIRRGHRFGIYYLALSTLVFFRGIQEQLITAPYLVYAQRRSGAAAEVYAGSALVHQLALGALSTTVVGAMLLMGIGPTQVKTVWFLLLGIAPLYLLRDFVRQMLFAGLNLRLAFALDLLVAVVQLGLMFPLAMKGLLNVELTWLSIALASGLAALLWTVTKPETYRGSLSASRTHALENWTFARWALLTQVIGSSTPYLMPWIVAGLHGAKETGSLGACTTMVSEPIACAYCASSITVSRFWSEHDRMVREPPISATAMSKVSLRSASDIEKNSPCLPLTNTPSMPRSST
jgi:hypothetical protein